MLTLQFCKSAVCKCRTPLAVGILLRCARSGTRFYLHSWQNVHKEPRDIRKQSSGKIREAFNNGRVSSTFTSTIYSRKANRSHGVRDIKVDVVVTFCWITPSSCFARVFIFRATNFNYMLLSFNIISKSCSFVLFSCQIKKLWANVHVSLVRAIFWYEACW